MGALDVGVAVGDLVGVPVGTLVVGVPAGTLVVGVPLGALVVGVAVGDLVGIPVGTLVVGVAVGDVGSVQAPQVFAQTSGRTPWQDPRIAHISSPHLSVHGGAVVFRTNATPTNSANMIYLFPIKKRVIPGLECLI